MIALSADARGLDHIVHAVRDLDAAAELYRRLGFTVGARNRHPWGTHNHIVQLPGFFIELLTLAEPDKLGSDGFSILFGAYNRDFIKRGEGLSLLDSGIARCRAPMRPRSAPPASPRLAAMRFEREGKRPDGSAVKVGFSLAFADDKLRPISVSAPASSITRRISGTRRSRNTPMASCGVAGVVLVAESRREHRDFLLAYTGAASARPTATASRSTPRGAIDVMTPAAFTGRFGVAAPDDRARRAAGRAAACDRAPTAAQDGARTGRHRGAFADGRDRRAADMRPWAQPWYSSLSRPVDRAARPLHGPRRMRTQTLDQILLPNADRHRRRRALRQCPAAGADRRPVRSSRAARMRWKWRAR